MKNKYSFFLIFIGIFLSITSTSQTYNIKTIAGDGTGGFAGDNNAATAAELNAPAGVAIDALGNVYIADQGNQRIRKVSAGGVITTIAGNGTGGFGGDNGAATAAELNYPAGIAVDDSGNVYIADQSNQRIRKVNTKGIITTIAGNGTGSFAGDNGAATAAELYFPAGVAIDGSGNLYIADFQNYRIRKISTGGVITTIAGNGTIGFSGDNGAATAAELYNPVNITADGSGNVYIADQNNQRIRKVSGGVITTIVGNGTQGFAGDNGAATSAVLSDPSSITFDSIGNMYIADASNNRIRKINTGGIITTFAGDGNGGFAGDNGAATSAELNYPDGIAIDYSGNFYIADQGNNRIRTLTLAPTEVNEISVNSENIKVFPNPNHGRFTLELSATEDKSTIEIYNMVGQQVYTKELQQTMNNYEIDMNGQSAGLYIYRIVSEKGECIGSNKFIIQ